MEPPAARQDMIDFFVITRHFRLYAFKNAQHSREIFFSLGTTPREAFESVKATDEKRGVLVGPIQFGVAKGLDDKGLPKRWHFLSPATYLQGHERA